MKNALVRRIEDLTFKQLVVALIGPGLVLLAIDAAIGHFAGKDLSHPGQLAPVIYGVIGGVLLSALGLRPVRLSWVRVLARFVGVVGFFVGAAGSVFHLIPMWKDLSDETLSVAAIEGALSVAPPLFAPMAFCGIGVLLWCIGAPRFYVGMRDPRTVAREGADLDDVDALIEEGHRVRHQRDVA